MLIASFGCTEATIGNATAVADGQSVDSASVREVNQSLPVIEAGIVLADRASHLCWPAEHVNIQPDDKIVSLESSCECVTVHVMYYQDTSSRSRRGISVNFVPDGEPDTTERPASLSVHITVLLASGERREFNVNLLHTRGVKSQTAKIHFRPNT